MPVTAAIRCLLDRLRNELLRAPESPHRLALAFGIGVSIAFSPTHGLHTVTALFCAWAFRLNVMVVMAGNLMNNPWTIMPIIGATLWTGMSLTGQSTEAFTFDDWSVATVLSHLSPYMQSFIVGGLLLSMVGGLLGYVCMRLALRAYGEARAAKRVHELQA